MLLSVKLAIFVFLTSFSNDVDNYFQTYRKDFITNYSLEQKIIQDNTIENLIGYLSPYYKDSILQIRQKAYYLTYKKALQKESAKKNAVSILLKGCDDKEGVLVGQNIEYLKNFQLEDFSEESIQYINSKLTNHRMPHYNGFALLAGFVNTGKDILFQKLLDNSVSSKIKWSISLALARMGNDEQIHYCIGKIKDQPLSDAFVNSLIPDLIYMRQKEGIDYCVKIISSNDKLCYSLNPDSPEKIICGFRVLEMLAPIIVDAPFSVDELGFLKTNNPEKILEETRRWFEQTPNYQIRKNIY